MDAFGTIALVTGALAAFAALVNAAVSAVNALRDYRGLKISLVPDVWGELGSVLEEYLWTLTIVNNARASNAIREAVCFIDSNQIGFIADPGDLLRGEIKAYSSRQGWLKVRKEKIRGDFQTLEFTIRPVRGRL